jgi:hypothetical protein
MTGFCANFGPLSFKEENDAAVDGMIERKKFRGSQGSQVGWQARAEGCKLSHVLPRSIPGLSAGPLQSRVRHQPMDGRECPSR